MSVIVFSFPVLDTFVPAANDNISSSEEPVTVESFRHQTSPKKLTSRRVIGFLYDLHNSLITVIAKIKYQQVPL